MFGDTSKESSARLRTGESAFLGQSNLWIVRCPLPAARWRRCMLCAVQAHARAFRGTSLVAPTMRLLIGEKVSPDALCASAIFEDVQLPAFCVASTGFCVFSDIAVAAAVGLRDYAHIERVLVVDLDGQHAPGPFCRRRVCSDCRCAFARLVVPQFTRATAMQRSSRTILA